MPFILINKLWSRQSNAPDVKWNACKMRRRITFPRIFESEFHLLEYLLFWLEFGEEISEFFRFKTLFFFVFNILDTIKFKFRLLLILLEDLIHLLYRVLRNHLSSFYGSYTPLSFYLFKLFFCATSLIFYLSFQY